MRKGRKSAQLHVLSGIVAQNHSFLFLSSSVSIFTDFTFALSFSWRTSKRERSAERREANVSPLGLDGTVRREFWGYTANPVTQLPAPRALSAQTVS